MREAGYLPQGTRRGWGWHTGLYADVPCPGQAATWALRSSVECFLVCVNDLIIWIISCVDSAWGQFTSRPLSLLFGGDLPGVAGPDGNQEVPRDLS